MIFNDFIELIKSLKINIPDILHDSNLRVLSINTHLIGFDNGVYDLNNREFRLGKFTDYVVLSCGYNFEQISILDDRMVKLNIYLDSIFPDENIKTNALKIIATSLGGTNLNEFFTIFKKNKSSGFSTFIKFIQLTLGEYFINFEEHIEIAYLDITGKRFGYFETISNSLGKSFIKILNLKLCFN